MTDEQMREYIDHAIEKILAPMLEKQSAAMMAQLRANAADVVKQWEKYPTREERLAEEERRAWDMYAAAEVGRGRAAPDAAGFADVLLEERRKRFGAGKKGVVIDELLVRRAIKSLDDASAGVRGKTAEAEYGNVLKALIALVSE